MRDIGLRSGESGRVLEVLEEAGSDFSIVGYLDDVRAQVLAGRKRRGKCTSPLLEGWGEDY